MFLRRKLVKIFAVLIKFSRGLVFLVNFPGGGISCSPWALMLFLGSFDVYSKDLQTLQVSEHETSYFAISCLEEKLKSSIGGLSST